MNFESFKNRIVRMAMVWEHQYDIDDIVLMVNDECETNGINARQTCEIVDAVKQKITGIRDYRAGRRDCKQSIYDKWYRYNRRDDGAAYDKGWMDANKTQKCEVVTFLNA